MLFSVLLPVRNAGPLLRPCIASVLAQDDPDLELVVADSASTDETPTVLAEFAADPRLRVIRLDRHVSQVENWNAALGASRGDYLLMIGDDDYLLLGFCSSLRELLERHHRPDIVVYNAYSYVFPGAFRGQTESYFTDPLFVFGPDFAAERLLTPAQARAVVREMFRFRALLPLAAPTMLFSRRACARIPPPLFRPPAPDHYALCALLLNAERALIAPRLQPVVVGTSCKSMRAAWYEHREVLPDVGADADFPGRLPGDEMVSALWRSLLALQRDFPKELEGLQVSRADYVLRQLFRWLLERLLGEVSRREALDRLRLLSPSDWTVSARALLRPDNARKLARVPGILRDLRARHRLRPLPDVADISGFAHWLQARLPSTASKSSRYEAATRGQP